MFSFLATDPSISSLGTFENNHEEKLFYHGSAKTGALNPEDVELRSTALSTPH